MASPLTSVNLITQINKLKQHSSLRKISTWKFATSSALRVNVWNSGEGVARVKERFSSSFRLESCRHGSTSCGFSNAKSDSLTFAFSQLLRTTLRHNHRLPQHNAEPLIMSGVSWIDDSREDTSQLSVILHRQAPFVPICILPTYCTLPVFISRRDCSSGRLWSPESGVCLAKRAPDLEMKLTLLCQSSSRSECAVRFPASPVLLGLANLHL